MLSIQFMQPTQAEREAMMREIAAHEYELYKVRLASKTNDKWNGYHPDNIRKEITRLTELLKEALS